MNIPSHKTSTKERPKKDGWDILDILLKGVLAVGVSGAATFYSITADQRAEDNRQAENARAAEDRNAQTLIQMVNARESADADLRARMFQTLMQHYFNREDIESQIVVLELIGLNFRDSMQIKPMFEQIDRKLAHDDSAAGSLHRKLLRNAARTIISDQLHQIERAKDGYVCRSKGVPLGAIWEPDCLPGTKLALVTVAEDKVSIRPITDGDSNSNNTSSNTNDTNDQAQAFDVTYFDMPMVDFTVYPDAELKYAVVLTGVDAKSRTADLALAVLPTAIFNSQHNSYQFDALLYQYLPTKE